MTISALAGKPAPTAMLVDVSQLEREYYARKPDTADPNQLVVFGTSGHRGSSLIGSFTEAHIAAITQAICDYRRGHGIDGPLYMGKDTHALSDPAQRTALEVLVMDLLAAEITARTGKDPVEHYRELTSDFGAPCYTRIDAPATPAQKATLAKLSPEAVQASTIAGDPIIAKLTRAPGNGAPIGGLKVVTRRGWFAARPSGTENLYKIYAESMVDQSHLDAIMAEARTIVDSAMGSCA